ncbi:tyrosine-type recombinase/integrase [Streptomyces sp. NPDC087437]|uniref:tyrosine-type recombinase/integrase n=1 Tax=Streptomyces sp. NPDC087437 TaxID=3365789 RepID=UPI0037F1CBAD
MPVQSTAATRECDCLAHRFGNAADNPLRERRYPTDMTDEEWAVVRPLLPVPGWMRGRGGQPEAYCHRAMLDAIGYLVDNGIKWRAMPADCPPWDRVYAFFRRWRDHDLVREFHDRLRGQVREKAGRDAQPTAGVIDSQSVKADAVVGVDSRGFDGGKLVNGRKRHVVVDTLGQGVTDRPADVWEPLLAVADAAGGHWPARARAACLELISAAHDNDEASLGVRLLTDLRDKVFCGAARRDPLYAAFVLAVAMGLRRGELVGLRWSDVDLDNRVLHVRQQTQRRRGTLYDDDPKSRRSRVVPMPALCIAPLRWHRLRQREAFARTGVAWSETGYVFATRNGRPVEPRNVYRSFTRVAADAGLRVVRLHDTRHGCATLLTAAGVAPRVIMEILGHSQISITMDVYTHVVHDTQREAISHMDRLLKRRLPAA